MAKAIPNQTLVKVAIQEGNNQELLPTLDKWSKDARQGEITYKNGTATR